MSKEPLFSVTKKDFVVQTFRAGGKGGQKQNKTDSGVRIQHPESGAVGECRETRSQHKNKEIAFKRLVDTPEFKSWHRRKCAEYGQAAERIKEWMRPENMRVEGKKEGRWVQI